MAELIENAAGGDESGEEDNQEGIALEVDEPEEMDDDDSDEEEKKEEDDWNVYFLLAKRQASKQHYNYLL